MTMIRLGIALGVVLLGSSGCVVAPTPPVAVAAPPYYGYYPGYLPYYAPYYDYPWYIGPSIGVGFGYGWGGWGGWHGGGGRR